MNLDLPPLTWLRAFEASARTLSFTQAAAELHLTQAAVSKHVKALEQHVRRPLFIRRPRGLELTKSGAAYLPKVQDAMERLAIGTREVFGQRRSSALTLRCAVSFAVNWLAPRLPDYLNRYPGKTIRLLSSVWKDAFDAERFRSRHSIWQRAVAGIQLPSPDMGDDHPALRPVKPAAKDRRSAPPQAAACARLP